MGNLTDNQNDWYAHNATKLLKKTITFAGGTTNAIGDFDGTGNPFTIATVTGVVAAKVFGVCKTDLVGTGTLEVGVTDSTAAILAQITNASTFIVPELYVDATPTTSVEALTVVPENIVTGNIIGTVGTANITAGVVDFIIVWRPLSPGATLTV